jgi:uncharacterized membrane protein
MIPDPLHPAIVHFPIVLLLLGAPLAIIAIFLRKWHLPWLVALVLTTGALGAIAATWTGGQDEEVLGELTASADTILEQHEEWGERTRNVAVLAAALALLAAAFTKLPKASIPIGVLAAMASLAAALCVAQAGHYGGLLVYKHGAGINLAAGRNAPNAEAGNSGLSKEQKKGDDD